MTIAVVLVGALAFGVLGLIESRDKKKRAKQDGVEAVYVDSQAHPPYVRSSAVKGRKGRGYRR